jgi:ribonuclease D
MTLPMLAQATYIDNLPDLHKLVELLRTEKHIAFDTESNSLHAYRGQTCLIQLSTHHQDFIIDPLLIEDIGVLGEIFADPNIEKIFHAAEFDLICLKRDFDFDVVNVFDTMAAARVCGYERVGLTAMLSDLLGVQHNKSHQKGDWGQRPLPDGYLRYAQGDTHYLYAIRDSLVKELDDLGRLDEAYEYFDDMITFEVKSLDFDPDGFWGLGRPHTLTLRQKAVLREVYILRDELAKMYDYPTHKLIGNKALVAIARELPRHRNELYGIHTLPDWVVKQSGDEIIEAISHGQSSQLPQRPPYVKPPPPDVTERYTALHTWRKNTALQREIYSDVIISKQTLWKIAYLKPQAVDALNGLQGIGPWRLKTYGRDLIEIVNNPVLID